MTRRCICISVIIPIYNVSSYLDTCVKSIVSQTFDNLEIILVDDGSPDECPALCDAWSSQDGRVKVIHKTNGGLSDARNAGIEIARGDYILFVDADDYIEPDMCERLLEAVENSSSDIAVCSFYWDYSDRSKIQPMGVPNGMIIHRSEIMKFWARHGGVEFVVPVNKIYRRELFFTEEHIRYPVGRLHEDEFTSYRLLYAARSVVFIDTPLYHYVQRGGSIMANLGERNLRDFAEAVRGYIPWAEKWAPVMRKVMECMTMRYTLAVTMRSADNPQFEHGQEISVSLQAYAEQNVKKYLFNPYASWKDKIKYILFKLGCLIVVMKYIKKVKEII